MKNILTVLTLTIIFIFLHGCMNKGSSKKDAENPADTITVPDTGYTGIKQYYSHSNLTYEVTFKNGVRHGLMKTYYPTGRLRQTFWYENGMREDTAIWYYEDGKIFRKTPYEKDSINGLQSQYYKSGKVKARLDYVNGMRKPYLEEFTMNGKKVTDYPVVVINTKDEYILNGTYSISVGLNKPGTKANFYMGDYSDGLFDKGKLKEINNSESTGFVKLRKSGNQGPGYAGIISEILTPMGNRLLVYNRIDLPYKDLK